MDKYLTPQRIASLKQYLADCTAGVSQHEAWKSHKARMSEPNSFDDAHARDIAKEEKRVMFLISGEPCAERNAASKTFIYLNESIMQIEDPFLYRSLYKGRLPQ